MTNAIGPDFSHWDGTINFDELASSGASFAWFKIGQGLREDPQLNRSLREANNYGIPAGGYWYYDALVHPVSQAQTLTEIVRGKALPLGIAVDYEDPRVGTYGGWRHLAVFMQKVMDLLQIVPERMPLYTTYYYWMDHRPSPAWNVASYFWFKKFPLWLAQYNGLSAPNRIPGPWFDWLFWQYSKMGDPVKYGSQKMSVDLSQFHGDQAALDRWLVGAPLPPAPPPTVYRGVVRAPAGLNVRTEPSPTATKIGALRDGAALTGDELRVMGVNKWLHLTAPLVGWAAQEYQGTELIRLA